MKTSPYAGVMVGRNLGTAASKVASISNGTFWLYIYFLCDYFLHFAQRFSGYAALRPTLLLFLLLSGVLFAQREKLAGRSQDPIFQAIFMLLGYIVFSLILVEYQGSVIRNNLPDFVKAIIFLFFTAFIIDSEKRLKIFLFVFVGCQVLRVLEPLYLNITQGYWGSATYLSSGESADRLAGAPSDVVNSNGLGFVLVTALPFLHYLLFTGRLKAKLLYLSIMPCLFYALILTMSRGAFLAFLVVAWMIFKESSHKMILILVAIAIALSGWSVMNANQKDRYLSLVSDDVEGSSSVDGRLSLITHEFELGLERPIVGHGLGTTSEAKYHAWGRKQASHNMYGELLIEIGIIGAVLFLIFIARIYRRFKINRELLKAAEKNMEGAAFYSNLNKALVAVFWMYVVYSINYYGLSQYYWYLLGGLAIAFGRTLDFRLAEETKITEATGEQSESKSLIAPDRKLSLRERSRDWARVMR